MAKESTKKVSSVAAEKIITDLILIAVGILFCLNLATKVVNITVGVALCLYGAVNIVIAAADGKSLFSALGVWNAVIVALGIACIVLEPLDFFILLVPYVFCVVGGVFILDACLAMFVRKSVGTAAFVLEFAVGAACLALGLCLLFVDAIAARAGLIFGLGLIAFAAYHLIKTLVKKK